MTRILQSVAILIAVSVAGTALLVLSVPLTSPPATVHEAERSLTPADQTPAITLNQSTGSPGASVTVSGTDFAPSASVTLYFNAVETGTTTSSNTGTFSAPFTVPALPAGTYAVEASDSGGDQASTPFEIVPEITVFPSAAPVGSTVSVEGDGFAALSSVTVVLDGQEVGTPGTNAVGGFASLISVPSIPTGPYTLTGTDGDSNQAVVGFTVTPPASIGVSPGQGPPGAPVTVSGMYFPASSTVQLVFDGVAVSSCNDGTSLTTGSTGSFSCDLAVPAGTSGTMVDATVIDGPTASAVFNVTTPAIVLVPDRGPVGSTVIVDGSGFSISSYVGPINFASVFVSTCESGTLTTNATGAFSCGFAVPAGTEGPYIEVTDPGGLIAFASFDVTSTSVTITPGQWPVGAAVSVVGTGFSASSRIVLVFDGVTITSCSKGNLKTTSAGNFHCKLEVPSSAGDSDTTVTVTDAAGDQASGVFEMTTPQIEVSPSSGPVGTKVVLTGVGFSVESRARLVFDGVSITRCPGGGSLKSNASGAFTCKFRVPSGTSGTEVLATDVGGATTVTSFTVTTAAGDVRPVGYVDPAVPLPGRPSTPSTGRWVSPRFDSR